MADLFVCPVCSGLTELHESPLVELADAFTGYVQCSECGSSSHEEGFTPPEADDVEDQDDLFS